MAHLLAAGLRGIIWVVDVAGRAFAGIWIDAGALVAAGDRAGGVVAGGNIADFTGPAVIASAVVGPSG